MVAFLLSDQIVYNVIVSESIVSITLAGRSSA